MSPDSRIWKSLPLWPSAEEKGARSRRRLIGTNWPLSFSDYSVRGRDRKRERVTSAWQNAPPPASPAKSGPDWLGKCRPLACHSALLQGVVGTRATGAERLISETIVCSVCLITCLGALARCKDRRTMDGKRGERKNARPAERRARRQAACTK